MTRRVWFARDCWLHADPKVEHLADAHGPAGVLAFEEILALAKLANQKGAVTLTYSQLARRAYLKSTQQARTIVSVCADLGLLDLVQADSGGCSARVGRFARWQVTDPTAAERKAAERGKLNQENGSSHAEVTANVTDRNVTNP